MFVKLFLSLFATIELMSLALFIFGLIMFIGLVVVHEWGHFIMARRNGVEVEEFGIFFPPRLFKRKTKNGWLFTINALPLGGFVKLKGEHDSDTEKGSFGAATTWVKTKIMAAGVVMNLVTALVLFTIVAMMGMPQLVDNQYMYKPDTKITSQQVLVSYIEPGSPAEKAGLQPQDELNDIRLPGYSPVGIPNAKAVKKITRDFAGKEVIIYYTRDGEQKSGKTKLLTEAQVKASAKTDNPKGYLGIVPNDLAVARSTWSAPVVAVGLSAQLTQLTFQGLGNALAGLGSAIAGGATGNTVARQNGQEAASSQVSGPVGIFVILQNGSSLGLGFMLFIIAYISLTLAIMNILPIPALDGGRLWLMLFSRLIRRPISPRAEEIINASGFALLIGLIVLITFVDVKRFF